MNERIDWSLLARFMAGECPSKEMEYIRRWRAESEGNERCFQEILAAWEAAGGDELKIDVDSAWRRLQQASRSTSRRRSARIPSLTVEYGEPNRPSAARRRRIDSPIHRRLARSRRWAASAAGAVALLVLLLLLLPAEMSPLASLSNEGEVFATRKGQRATVDLTDGSRVQLNADSKLTLSPAFESGVREVHLQGEAHFRIASDAGRAFVVTTSHASIEVVGTVFGVDAYASGQDTRVAVAEGAVVLRPTGRAATTDTVVLRGSHLGVASADSVQATREGAMLEQIFGWTDGRLIFSDAEFHDVVRRLERWYDLDVESKIPTSAVDRLNATFEHEPLDQVLADISLALGLRYQKRGEQITFFR